jgi:hypothetical protein
MMMKIVASAEGSQRWHTDAARVAPAPRARGFNQLLTILAGGS